jgi:hypothetical protein
MSPLAIADAAPAIPLMSFTALLISVIAFSTLDGTKGDVLLIPVTSVLMSLKILLRVFIKIIGSYYKLINSISSTLFSYLFALTYNTNWAHYFIDYAI